MRASPVIDSVPFGDLDALAKLLAKRDVAAFVVEPILGEGGVVVPRSGYLAEAQALCRRHGTLLVLDEVQTGIGRTGSLFAFEREGFVPDLLVLGKSLGGGLAPVSCVLSSTEVHDRAYGSMRSFDLHSTTFAGYALGCAAALETLAIVRDEKLCENSFTHGERLLGALRAKLADHPLVREVRGRGLLVGIELGPPREGLVNRVAGAVTKQVFGQWLAVRLLEAGIVAQPASQDWNVLRLEPPLTISAAEIDRVTDTIAGVLGEYRDVASIVKDATARIGAQALAGWGFR
jgi:putrescine aminotransferase